MEKVHEWVWLNRETQLLTDYNPTECREKVPVSYGPYRKVWKRYLRPLWSLLRDHQEGTMKTLQNWSLWNGSFNVPSRKQLAKSLKLDLYRIHKSIQGEKKVKHLPGPESMKQIYSIEQVRTSLPSRFNFLPASFNPEGVRYQDEQQGWG